MPSKAIPGSFIQYLYTVNKKKDITSIEYELICTCFLCGFVDINIYSPYVIHL